MNRLSGWEYHTLRTVIEDIPAREGSLFVNSLAGRRNFSWQGVISGSDRDNWLSRRRDLIKVLTPGLKTVKITTDDSLSLQVQAEVNDIVMDQPQEFLSYGRYFISMVAPDFRLLSQTLNSATTAVTTSAGGFTIPATIPIDFSSASGTEKLTVTNIGTADSDPTFRITGPGTTFTVQNVTTNQLFNLNLTLASGEYVDVNVTDRTALQGGLTNVYGNFDGDWWTLAPGDNLINFNASSGTSSDTQLRVQHRDSYNGI